MPAETTDTAALTLTDTEASGAEFVRRAIALRPALLAEQEATERRTRYSETTFATLRDQGFFSMLAPRRFRGHAIDLPSYVQTIIELARGCPSSAWCTTLAAGHAQVVGTRFSEQAQLEIFGEDGKFVAPLSGGAHGVTARRVDGGWIINGKWAFCSGVPYATHFAGSLPIPANEVLPNADGDTTPVPCLAVITDGWKMLDDWGDLIGLRGSGSNTVEVTDAFVPEGHVVHFDLFPDVTQGTPGYRLHNDLLFATPFMPIGWIELHALAAGMLHAMVDELHEIVHTRKMMATPMDRDGAQPGEVIVKADYWYQDQIYQQAFGQILAYADSAKAIVIRTAQMIEESTRAAIEDNVPYTAEDMLRHYGQGMTAADLAWRGAEIAFRTASSSAARDGQRMQRYWRDSCAFRSNGIHNFQHRAGAAARAHFALAPRFL